MPEFPSGLELSCRFANAEALSGSSCGGRSGSAVLALAICQCCVLWQCKGKHLKSLKRALGFTQGCARGGSQLEATGDLNKVAQDYPTCPFRECLVSQCPEDLPPFES